MLTAALLCIMLLGTSCSKNDDNGFSIVGEWNIDQVTFVMTNGDVVEGTEYNASKMQFMSDGNGIMYDEEGDVIDIFDYSFEDGTLLFTPEGYYLHVFNVEVVTSTNIILDLEYHEDTEFYQYEQITLVLSKI